MSAILVGSREDLYNVTVSVTRIVAGKRETKSLGTFDGMTGGEVDSDDTKFNPGGLAAQISLGGKVTVGNVTVNRLYDPTRDHPLMGWLMAGVGKAQVTVTKTLLDVDGIAQPNPLVYTGKCKTITPPDHDSESSDAAKWSMEISSATVTQNT